MKSPGSPLLDEIRRIQERTKEARSREARASFELQAASRKRTRDIWASALSPEQLAGLKAAAPPFVSEVFRSREEPTKKRPSPPTVNATAPWEFDWQEKTPAEADMTWYGPDRATGQLGGRLVSQAAGDRQAITSVGMSYYASQTRPITVRAFFHINRSYLDAGGMSPSSGSAKLDLSISAFENDVKFGITTETYSDIQSTGYVPPFPHFNSQETGDKNAHIWLNLQAEAGHLYTFYFECVQYVGTWGPAGAQCDADVVVTSALVAE